ncbi:MAG: sensor histidine kinase [Oscillospiraceae bacterium]
MKSIRYYFFNSISIILVASLLVMGIVQANLVTNFFHKEKTLLLQQVVTGIANGTKTGKLTLTPEKLSSVDYMAHVAGAVVFVTDPGGSVVYCTEPGNPTLDSKVSAGLLANVLNAGIYQEKSRLEDLYGEKQFVVASGINNSSGQNIGFVFAVSPVSGSSPHVADIMLGYLLSALLVMVVASVVALFISNRMVVPIKRLSQAAQQFGEGDYSARVPVQGDDELARLAITFNEMANSFESTDASRRSFMGNIAHELRTPMTTIKGFIDGILDGTIPADQRQKYLGVVSEEVGRLARLTKNMLDISRLEAGEYVPQTKVFDIWKPIAMVLVSAQQRLEEKNIEITGAEENQPLYILADEDFVHQVLFNLLDNAIKFTNPGGTISISVKAQKNMALFSIRNTGAGISPKALPFLFERFYKVDQNRSFNVRGSGLGLHICKVLVNLMGGRIWAASEENAFSEFSFTLPSAPQRKAGAWGAEQKQNGGANKKNGKEE